MDGVGSTYSMQIEAGAEVKIVVQLTVSGQYAKMIVLESDCSREGRKLVFSKNGLKAGEEEKTRRSEDCSGWPQ